MFIYYHANNPIKEFAENKLDTVNLWLIEFVMMMAIPVPTLASRVKLTDERKVVRVLQRLSRVMPPDAAFTSNLLGSRMISP